MGDGGMITTNNKRFYKWLIELEIMDTLQEMTVHSGLTIYDYELHSAFLNLKLKKYDEVIKKEMKM